VTAAVEGRHGYAAPEQTLLGDAAAWCWALGAAIVSEATPVWDRWHVADARQRTRRHALVETEERATWTARLDACLAAGDVPSALVALTDLAQLSAAPEVDAFAAFLVAQAPRIPDYAARRAAGLPIGSGGVEKGAAVVINRRCKGKRGMKGGGHGPRAC
jgi:hypothetical protein